MENFHIQVAQGLTKMAVDQAVGAFDYEANDLISDRGTKYFRYER